jgi:putative nucleotidyltransferase with HDIG domain
MTADTREFLCSRMREVDRLPAMPAILRPALQYMLQPVDSVDVARLSEMIAGDVSLAAQCLHMANSALYSRVNHIESVRGAVAVLGIAKVREILFSCALVRLVPRHRWLVDPVTYWEHSFGVALVSRHFAREIGYSNAEKAYLAGLLHDIGTIVNTTVFHEEYRAVVEKAFASGMPFAEAERAVLEFTHEDTGDLLAEAWGLPKDVREVIRCHHNVQGASLDSALTAIISLSDQLCRMRGLGYGYYEPLQVDFMDDPAWALLVRRFPKITRLDIARFTFEMEGYVTDVRTLVTSVFREQRVGF